MQKFNGKYEVNITFNCAFEQVNMFFSLLLNANTSAKITSIVNDRGI